MRFHLKLPILCLILAAFAAGKEKEKPAKTPIFAPKAGIKTPGIQIPFASLKTEADLPMDAAPSSLFTDATTLLVPIRDKGTVARVSVRDNKVLDAWKGFDQPCGGVISAFGNLWIPNCGNQTISRVEARSGKVTATVPVSVGKAMPALAATADSVWVLADDKTTLVRVDPKENTVVSELRLSEGCNSVIFEAEALWVSCPAANRILRIDSKTNLVDKRIDTAKQPVSMAYGENHLWVLCATEGKVAKIDPKTNKVVTTIETGVPNAGGTLSFGDGHVWVTAAGYPLTKINAQSDKVVQQFVGEGGGMIRFAANAIWLVNPAKSTVSRIDPKRVAATLAE